MHCNKHATTLNKRNLKGGLGKGRIKTSTMNIKTKQDENKDEGNDNEDQDDYNKGINVLKTKMTTIGTSRMMVKQVVQIKGR